MRRCYKHFLEDMIVSAQSIVEYVGGFSREAFFADKMRVDAVNSEIPLSV
jgi:uncharacterized protein with HEPN domain